MKKNKPLAIDLSQLEPIDTLDAEEQEWHELLKSGQLIADSSPATIKKYASIFKESRKQRKAISLRMPTQDYFAIKTKASELGLPYQALINSVIHQYVMGQLKAT